MAQDIRFHVVDPIEVIYTLFHLCLISELPKSYQLTSSQHILQQGMEKNWGKVRTRSIEDCCFFFLALRVPDVAQHSPPSRVASTAAAAAVGGSHVEMVAIATQVVRRNATAGVVTRAADPRTENVNHSLAIDQ